MLLLLTACFLDEKACDTMAVASVNVTVVDADGATVPDAVVSWRLDDGEWTDCESMGDTWACGWEVAGDLDIRVEAEGYDTVETPVSVVQGECHVEAEALTVTLEPIECTAEAIASVVASVSGSSGEELTGVAVAWGYADAEMEPQPCEDGEDGTWVCGWEVAGDLEITAVADGHAAEVQVVTVTADECHVTTEYVDFALDWLPD